ncbi:MAG: branched-chain amino acid ABC transporter permease [Deltaproteobacteria bacterium]|nr:branched-chain amino acid ABC transporter permease [Deltaproteobacteria bacterium]
MHKSNGSNKSMINRQGDWRTRFEFRAMIVAFIFAPFLPFIISKPLATEIIVYGLFALGFNLLLGHTGIISFGHAAYLGVGAYSAAMIVFYGEVGVWLALLAATIGGLLVAIMIGILAIKRKGAYFAMISLAIGQMFFFLTLSPLTRWTGGEDGLKLPPLSIDFPLYVNLSNQLHLYFFILTIGCLATLAQWRILNSPFGHVLRAIRENEDRIRACGYNVSRVKFLSLIFSGLFSGLAGGLLVVYLGAASINLLFWMTSGVIVMKTVLGGTHTFFGPVIGAGVFLFLRSTISEYTDRWELWLGALFMVLILLFREGIWGSLLNLIEKRFYHSKL